MKNLLYILLAICLFASCSGDNDFDNKLTTSWRHKSDDLILNLTFRADGVSVIEYNVLKQGAVRIMNIKFKYEYSHPKIQMESTIPTGLLINGHFENKKLFLIIEGESYVFDQLTNPNF